MSKVWELSRARANDRLVLLALADVANDEGLITAYKRSQAILAAKCLISEQTIRRSIRSLADDVGELEVLGVGNGRASSDYRVRLEVLEGYQNGTPGVTPVVPQGYQNGTPGVTPVVPPSFHPDPSPPVLSQTLLGEAVQTKASDLTALAQVFDAWIQSTGRTATTRFDAKRQALIVKALKAYPLADVLDAVRGWEHSAYHRGDNDSGTAYNDLSLLLRDAAHIERFRDLARGPRQPDKTTKRSPMLANDQALQNPNYWGESTDE